MCDVYVCEMCMCVRCVYVCAMCMYVRCVCVCNVCVMCMCVHVSVCDVHVCVLDCAGISLWN